MMRTAETKTDRKNTEEAEMYTGRFVRRKITLVNSRNKVSRHTLPCFTQLIKTKPSIKTMPTNNDQRLTERERMRGKATTGERSHEEGANSTRGKATRQHTTKKAAKD